AEGVVPGSSKIVDPLEVEDARSVPSRDPLGRVGRSGIDDDHLVDEPGQRAQAGVEIAPFVLHDQARGEENPWPWRLDAGRTPAAGHHVITLASCGYRSCGERRRRRACLAEQPASC